MRLLDHSHDQHARSSLACSSHSRTSAAAGGQERRRPRPAAGALGEDVGCATAAAAAVGVMLLQAILAVAVVDAPLLVAGQDLVRCRSAPAALQCSPPSPLPAARARQSSFPLCARGNGARAPWFISANFFAASAFSSSVPFTLSCAPARDFAAGRPAVRRREVRHRPRGAALLGSLWGTHRMVLQRQLAVGPLYYRVGRALRYLQYVIVVLPARRAGFSQALGCDAGPAQHVLAEPPQA